LSVRLFDAIQFASEAHKGQTRKVTDLPFIVHPFSVAMILQVYGYPEDMILAGLLHDAIEDSDINISVITAKYGKNVSDLVDKVTNHTSKKGKTWREYKQIRINNVRTLDIKPKLIIAADKLDEIRSLTADHKVYKDDLWKTLKLEKEDKRWYMIEISKALCSNRSDFKEHKLLRHLRLEVKNFFNNT